MSSSELLARLLRKAASALPKGGDARRRATSARSERVDDALTPFASDGQGQAERERVRGLTIGDRVRRALALLSAVGAALVCAALLFNYVIMPAVVRQGDLAIVPDLIGKATVAAAREAERAGLRARVDSERPDAIVPLGAVVAQVPQAGTEVKRGRTVALVVSSGIDMRRLPRLAGLNARQAQLDAEQSGFAISEAIEVHSDHVERGRVIGTHPSEGASLAAGSGITMMVSLGPRPAELVMPSLVGRTPEEARLIAEALGLVMRSVKYERSRTRVDREIVVAQDPVAGSHVVEGEAVTLRIGD
jgi:serine/threonine-protein kinase